MGSQEEHQKLVDELLFCFGSMPNVRAWPRNVGLAYRDGQPVRYGIVGETDISGIVGPVGRSFFCEAKTGKSVLSPKQVIFKDMVIKFGAIYVLARSNSFEDIPNAVEIALTDFRRQL